MKRIISSVFAIGLFGSLPALAAPADFSNQKFAQRNNDEGRGPERGVQGDRNVGRGQGGPDRGPQGNERAPAQAQGGPRTGAPQPAQAAPDRGGRDNNRNNRGPAQSAQQRGNAGRQVEHGPSQFERRAFQRNFTAPRRFRAAAYRAPQGWQYHRWAFGESLPRLYWAQPYWITNFWLYDLDRPPQGCEWVRSGPDALLVDVTTGEILQAEYNVFY